MLAVISLYQKQAKSMFDHFCYTLDPVLNMEAEPTSLVDRNKSQFGNAGRNTYWYGNVCSEFLKPVDIQVY